MKQICRKLIVAAVAVGVFGVCSFAQDNKVQKAEGDAGNVQKTEQAVVKDEVVVDQNVVVEEGGVAVPSEAPAGAPQGRPEGVPQGVPPQGAPEGAPQGTPPQGGPGGPGGPGNPPQRI